MPLSVIQFPQSCLAVRILSVDGQLHLSRSAVDSKKRKPVPQLQEDEIPRIRRRERFHRRTGVQHQAVLSLGDELEARVALGALGQGSVPGPAVPREALVCLLASGAVETTAAAGTRAPGSQTREIKRGTLLLQSKPIKFTFVQGTAD